MGQICIKFHLLLAQFFLVEDSNPAVSRPSCKNIVIMMCHIYSVMTFMFCHADHHNATSKVYWRHVWTTMKICRSWLVMASAIVSCFLLRHSTSQATLHCVTFHSQLVVLYRHDLALVLMDHPFWELLCHICKLSSIFLTVYFTVKPSRLSNLSSSQL